MLTVATTSVEDMSAFVNLLGNGFFPIALCGVLLFIIWKLTGVLGEIKTTLSLMNERLGNLVKKDE